MSAQTRTPAQQAQLDNRDASGKFREKTHGEVESGDVLGVGLVGEGEREQIESFTPETRREVHEYLRTGGLVPSLSAEARTFLRQTRDRALSGPTGGWLSARSLAGDINDDRHDDGTLGTRDNIDVEEADVQGVLTELRNEGRLLSAGDDTGYRRTEPHLDKAIGVQITPEEALQGFDKTGYRVTLTRWQDNDRNDFTEPVTTEVIVDHCDDDRIVFVEGPGGDTHKVSLRHADGEQAETIIKDSDGTVHVRFHEQVDPDNKFVGVEAGGRWSFRRTDVTEDHIGHRPLTDTEGRQSPFNVGPRHYVQHPEYDGDQVALAQEVYTPEGQRIGTVYEETSEMGWRIDPDDLDRLAIDDPRLYSDFVSAQEAADQLHTASGSRGGWSKPTFEDVALPGLDNWAA